MLERGQLAASFRDIAANFGVDVGVVRRLTNRLTNDTMIDTHTDTGVNVITICNYDKYQKPEREDDTVNDTQTEHKPTHKPHTEQEDNKLINKYTVEFEAFWKAYPSRSPHPNPKKPAFQKWLAVIKSGVDPQTIIDGAKRYAAYIASEGTDRKHIAQAVTWLNQERWEQQDDIKPERKF